MTIENYAYIKPIRQEIRSLRMSSIRTEIAVLEYEGKAGGPITDSELNESNINLKKVRASGL